MRCHHERVFELQSPFKLWFCLWFRQTVVYHNIIVFNFKILDTTVYNTCIVDFILQYWHMLLNKSSEFKCTNIFWLSYRFKKQNFIIVHTYVHLKSSLPISPSDILTSFEILYHSRFVGSDIDDIISGKNNNSGG